MPRQFEIGQKVWIRRINNAAYMVPDDKLIEEWIVTKTGRKYLYAKRKGYPYDVCFQWNEAMKTWVEASSYTAN